MSKTKSENGIDLCSNLSRRTIHHFFYCFFRFKHILLSVILKILMVIRVVSCTHRPLAKTSTFGR